MELGFEMIGCWVHAWYAANALLRAVFLVVHQHDMKHCCNAGRPGDPGDPAQISPCCQAVQRKQIVPSFH